MSTLAAPAFSSPAGQGRTGTSARTESNKRRMGFTWCGCNGMSRMVNQRDTAPQGQSPETPIERVPSMIRPALPADTPTLMDLTAGTGVFLPSEVEVLEEVLDD